MRQLKITQSITNRRESHTLEKYFTEVSNVPMITPDEEVTLAKRIKEGDDLALEKLVKANLRFVVSVAKQYQNRSLPLNDLINEGNLGLIKAAKKFDETKGFKFISYAVWWIRQSIMQALAEQSRIVRLPMNKSGAINQIKRAYAELEQKYEREPTEEELAEMMEIKASDVRNTLGAEVKQVSIDAPFGEDESGSLLDVLENAMTRATDGNLVFNDSLKVETMRALATLTIREKEVIMMSFGIGYENPYTLEEIGNALGLTRERVRQIREKVLQKLREPSKNRRLKEFCANDRQH
ncbi:MAG: RNA polymerase sigma factor RpoD/SigA [Ekhidna sp.]|nr:RNA polymerase sigma factor RpoD/SigA [Ekhidna sp.]